MNIATYAKLRDGSWGVRVQGTVVAGASVTVTKKSGETKSETIAKVLWTGEGVSLCAIVASSRREPLSVDGQPAIRGQHWSSRGRGPVERLCAGGCGRRVSSKYAECYSCHQESLDAM